MGAAPTLQTDPNPLSWPSLKDSGQSGTLPRRRKARRSQGMASSFTDRNSKCCNRPFLNLRIVLADSYKKLTFSFSN